MPATFDTDGITFTEYPFPPASVYPNGRLSYAAIRDVDPGWPAEIRTLRGETLFLSAADADTFRAAIAAAGLTIVERVPVWELLLEPFLDTEFTPEDEARTLAMLERVGFSQAEVASLRGSVENAMLAFNSVHWDWVHLGHSDVLEAMRWPVTWKGITNRLFPRTYAEFYWHTMEIADRGRKPATSAEACGEP
jgi:hypothetical protein